MTALDRIRAEQIKSIYRNTPPGLTATTVAVSVLIAVLVYMDAAPFDRGVIFVATMFVQAGARLLLFRNYSRTQPPAEDWRRWALWFAIGAVAGGSIIGFGSAWMMAASRSDLQLTILLVIFASAGGAVSAFGNYLPAYVAFFIAISIGPVAWLMWQGDVVHVALAALYLLWFTAIIDQARRASLQFVETARLRFENLDLVENLRREKVAADEANSAKSRFLAAASHDLRQPVHALSLFVAAMRAHKMDDEARGLLDHVDASVRSMGGLFGGLLDISRLDAGVVEINRVPFAIQPLIERVCRDYAGDAAAKGVELRLRPSSAVVQSDPMLLERVVRNLVGNAVRYTERGKIVVGCRRGSSLSVRICDTGPGIPSAEHEQIFQEFYQLGNPERDRAKGVGLGLAIVKRLTVLLQHPMTLRSIVGKGSMFGVDVPFAPAGTNAVSTVTESVPGDRLQATGLILVIDDEAAIQAAMRSLLQSWGYEAIVTATCEEMLKRIATHREVPKLIICDYRLRDNENGIAVIERLRSEYNDDIPGMLITGDTAPDRLREAQDSGFLLLHKPVPNSKLRAAITHLIGA